MFRQTGVTRSADESAGPAATVSGTPDKRVWHSSLPGWTAHNEGVPDVTNASAPTTVSEPTLRPAVPAQRGSSRKQLPPSAPGVRWGLDSRTRVRFTKDLTRVFSDQPKR